MNRKRCTKPILNATDQARRAVLLAGEVERDGRDAEGTERRLEVAVARAFKPSGHPMTQRERALLEEGTPCCRWIGTRGAAHSQAVAKAG